MSDREENIAEQKYKTPSFYVGIGASAGGLEAIDAFFQHMPPDTGMAFIVIQHLSPDYKSLMVELLSRRTPIPVHRAEEGTVVEADNIYMIPPRKNLTLFRGRLMLQDQPRSGPVNLPIDIFLRSLAEDQKEKAVGIILSGTGSDGTRGVRAVKENGGLVMVQDEESAKFDGMPRNAVATGLADFILRPEEMPARLREYISHAGNRQMYPPENRLENEELLPRIFALLREKCNVDFTYYKINTVIRRIQRRMNVNRIDELRDYVRYLENYPVEIQILFKELLIGVTNFFRDREAFEILGAKYLPELFRRKEGREIRFWIPGCSTGEEAYSLAILCHECMEQTGKKADVKIFATDVDTEAVAKAGAGLYPESITADLHPRYVSQYFFRRDDVYQIARIIREMVVFAQQNLIQDPPFTNIDLISCRNLLIYFQPVMQSKALDMFVFSLNTDGLLMLGGSENTGEMADFFEPLHHKWQIYRATGKRSFRRTDCELLFSHAGEKRSLTGTRIKNQILRSYEEEKILERFLNTVSEKYLPFSLVVNENMELLQVIGEAASKYLQYPSGPITRDITGIIRKELAIPVSTGVHKALKEQKEVLYTNIPVSDRKEVLEIHILPVRGKKGQNPLAAVLLRENIPVKTDGTETSDNYNVSEEAEQRIADLEQDLQYARGNLQATIEELETSNEELQASNEELLTSNEELQSTNQELQSVNEELYTVNAELQSKIVELSQANADLDNLFSGSGVEILFLDENLEIRKFTPRINRIFKILEHDVARPFSHLGHYLKGINLHENVSKVYQENKSMDAEVQTEDGQWYFMQILPYCIAPGTFSGISLLFVDISRLKEAQESLSRKQKEYALAVKAGNIGTWTWNIPEGSMEWSDITYQLFAADHESFKGNFDSFLSFIHPEDRGRVSELMQSATAKEMRTEHRIRRLDGTIRWMLQTGQIISGEKGKPLKMIGVMQDITHLKEPPPASG